MKRRIEIWLMAVVAMMLISCYDYDHDEVVVSGDPVRVDLAFTLSGAATNMTRMADAVVQTSSARDYDILRIIPRKGTTPDIKEFSNLTIVDKTNPQAHFYHYGNCDMSPGVNNCIVYAKAKADTPPDGVTSKAHNGSLKVFYNNTLSEGFPTISAETDISKISFEPVSMLESTIAPVEAVALATYLTNIITNASVTTLGNTYSWKSYNNNVLKKFFENFTNYENGSYNVIPGSAANVREWVSQLKSALEGYNLFTEGSIEDMLRNKIVDLCETTADVTTVEIGDNTYNITNLIYPRDVDLPDGAAVLKWDDTNNKFEPQTETTTLASINTITRYAYPPELYYFVESNIRCKDEQVNYQELYGENEKWKDFLDVAFPESSTEVSTIVTEATRAVALEDPVQYAVAHLQVKVQANPTTTGGNTFKDAANKDITIGDDKFPLTGVIVGGQRPLGYNFQPTTSLDAIVKFVYDSQVNTYDSESDTYAHNLSKTTTEMTNTLVLQSVDADNVTIILEFENKSGVLFHGVNNDIIYPNTRFYLVGTIAPTYDSTKGDYTRRVFTKDYTTLVNVTVSSLAGAYNVLPNILSSNLEIGVETTPQWIAATPSTVILE